jgi:hypothetical protein
MRPAVLPDEPTSGIDYTDVIVAVQAVDHMEPIEEAPQPMLDELSRVRHGEYDRRRRSPGARAVEPNGDELSSHTASVVRQR